MEYRNAPRDTGPIVVAFNGHIYGLDDATGEPRWSHKLLGPVIRLAFSTSHVFAAGLHEVLCVEYAAGTEVWRVQRRHSGDGQLLLRGDRLFVAANGELECISVTGEHLWGNGFEGKGFGAVAVGYPGNVVQADLDS